MGKFQLKNTPNLVEKNTQKSLGNLQLPSSNTDYQQNLAKVPEPQPVEWNTRNVLGRISQIAEKDQDKANQLRVQFSYLQQDKNSKYYNPYAMPTNRSVANLAAYGVDTSRIDDDFYKNNSYLFDYLSYDGTTNTPTKPGKKASAAEKAAYEFYQIWKSEGATKKAEQQWKALQQELSYWANRKDQNLSDDEIISRIDWSKYGELTGMDENKLTQPPEYNRAIGYSKDALYGVLWQARNPEYKGDIYGAMANSALGTGNVWQQNDEILKKRTPGTKEFNPYSLGSVGIDDAAVYYGVDSVDRQWLSEHQADAYSTDETRKKMYGKMYTAVQNYEKAQEALGALNAWIDNNIGKWGTEERAKKKIDEKLADGKLKVNGKEYDISILNKLDDSIGKNGEPGSGNMVPTSGAVDYKYDTLMGNVNSRIAQNGEKQNGSQFAGTASDAASSTNGAKTSAPVYQSNDETSAVVAAENDTLNQAADAFDEDEVTPTESGVRSNNTWSSSFGTVKITMDRIKIDGISIDSDLMTNAKSATIKGFSVGILGGSEVIQDYNATQQDLEYWEQQKAQLEESAGALEAKKMWDKAGFNMESWYRTGGDLSAQPSWDLLTDGQKAILSAMSLDSGESEIEEEFNSYIAMNRKAAGELTDDERAVLNGYQDAVNRIAEDEKYLADHKKENDEAVKKRDDAMSIYRGTIEMMNRSGVDTQEMEDAYNVSQFFTGFTKYEPTKWQSYSLYDEYSRKLYSGEMTWDEAYAEAEKDIKEVRDSIELGEWALEYADRIGMEMPGAMRENVQRWIDALKRQETDFENFTLIKNEDFKEKAEDARKAVNEIGFNWDAYNEAGGVEGLPLFDLLSDEEKQVLLKDDQEYKEGLTSSESMINRYENYAAGLTLQGRMFNLIGALSGTALATDLMLDYEQDTYYYLLQTQSADAAEEYYNNLVNSSYGVLNKRAAEKTQEAAANLAESGFLGRRGADVLSMLLSPVAAVGSLYYTLETGVRKLAGERAEFNPYNVNLTANIYKKEARQVIQQEILKTYGKQKVDADGNPVLDENGDPVYENTTLSTIMSSLQEIISNRGDSLVNSMVFGPLFSGLSSGVMNEFMSALPMAYSAATDAVADAKEKGANDTQLLGIFLSTMIAEAGTETISIHNIRDAFAAGKAITAGGIKEFLVKWLTESGISEMIGESLNDIIENTADEIFMGDNSDFKNTVEKYKTEEHMTEEDAIAAARRDQIMGVLHTALISYLSPGLDAVSYTAGYLKTLNAYRKYAKIRQKNGLSESMFELMRRDKAKAKEAMKAEQEAKERTETAEEAVVAEAETGETAPAETATETAPAETAPIAPDETTGEVAPAPQPVAQGEIAVENMPEAAPVETESAPVDESVADYAVLSEAMNADAASQAATVASVLDTQKTMESGDTAAAASAKIDTLTDGETSAEFVQNMIVGAYDAGVDANAVKQAIINAALSENSAARQAMNTDAYRNADYDGKAALLADTVAQDAANADVQSEIQKSVYEDRVSRAQGQLVVNGALKNVVEAEKAYQEAQTSIQHRLREMQQKNDILMAKQKALKDVEELYFSDPKTYEGQYHTALDEYNAAEAVFEEYEARYDNAVNALDKAKANLDEAKNEQAAKLRSDAEAVVAQEDAQRQQAKEEEALKQAEAERLKAEQEAQEAEAKRQQMIEDNRNGKAKEESDREKLIRLAKERGYEGEEAEKFIRDVMEFSQTRQMRNLDQTKALSDSEAYLMMGALSRRFGVNVQIAETEGNVNGYYDPSTDTIVLNKNLPAGQIMVEFALHELTHSLEKTGAYAKYQKTVLNALYPTEAELNDARAEMMARYEDAGHPLKSVEEADREIVAEFTRLRLNDKAMVQRMVDAGVGGAIRNALHNANQWLKNRVKALTKAEQESIAKENDGKGITQKTLTAEDLRRTERLFQKAIQERSKQMRKAREQTIKEGGTEIEYSTSVGEMSEAERMQSIREAAEDYQSAVERGDMEAAQEDVDYVAEQAGYTDKAYHGTPRFGFTEFDMERGDGTVFVSYTPGIASTYTHGQQRSIRADIERVSYDPSNPEQLIRIAQDEKTKYRVDKAKGWWRIKAIKLNEDGSYQISTGYNGDYTITGQELADAINENREIRKYGLGGIYQLYTRPGRQLVIDAQGESYSAIPVDWSEKALTAREIAQYAKEHGYDSVRINNVYDPGGQAKQDSDNYGDIGIFFNQDDVKSADPVTYDDEGNVIPLDQRFQSDNPDIRYSAGQGELSEAQLRQMDEAYAIAVEEGRREDAIQMLKDKASGVSRIVLFQNAEEYKKKTVKDIAHAIKAGNPEAVEIAASEMSKKVPENAVLVPMAPHTGTVEETTGTYILAKAISEKTGAPVVIALEGNNRESSLAKKLRTGSALKAERMGVRQIADIPEGSVPIIIDNVVSSGETARAAIEALGSDAIMLAYAKGQATKVTKGLKQLDITYDDNGNLIPLSQRMDISNPDYRYSSGEGEMTDAEKLQALVDAGIITQQDAESAPLEGQNPVMSTAQGPSVRAFAAESGMLSKSDELDSFAKAATQAQNTYFPDTNAEQINRAVKWIKSLKQTPNSDGYAEALQAVTDPTFDYRSADGQARMVAVMAMAVAKNDVMAQAALADGFMRQGTDLGRALQARKMFMLMTPQGRIMSLQKTTSGLQQELDARGYKGEPLTLSQWIYEAASVAENPDDFSRVQEAAATELAEQMPVSWKDKLRSWRMLSMLANPRTHIRNILGNFLFVPAVGIKNKLAAVMELGVKKGNKTKTLSPILSKEARAFANQDAEKNEKVIRGEAKYGQETKVRQEQKVFGRGNGLLSRTGGKALQWLVDTNSKFLENEDWFFLKGHYRRALGGWMMANGYTAAQLEANPQLLEKGRAYAIKEAQKATYRDFNQLAQTLNQVSRKGGAAGFIVDAVLPFKKTPANILKRGIEYSPVGIAKNITADLYHLKQYMDYQNGKLKALPANAISPTQFIDNLCSGLTGSAVMAAGYILANTGIVRCGMKDDDDELDKLEGAQEYSFEISIGGYDVSFTMDWAAPMSMPFFVGAAIRDQLANEGNINVEEIINAISNISEPVFNLSMLDGVNTLFKTSQNDDTNTITQILAKIGSNYVTSYVPSALGAVARSYDPIRRKAFVKSGEGNGVLGTVRYAIEQTENKIPGVSQSNIPIRDAFGRTSESPTWKRVLENFVLPGYLSIKQDDAVVNELGRLYDKTGDKKMIPSLPDKSFQAGGQSVKMEAEQYDQLTKERGETAYKLIQELMDNEYYKNVPAEDQAAMIEDAWTFATQNAKYNINPKANVETWVLNSRTDPVQGIVNRHKDTVDREYKTGYKQGALEAVRDGNNNTLAVCIEKLEEAGVKNAESSIKTYVANAYKPEYIRAYQDGDWQKMNEIETILENSDLDFDSDDYEAWIENMYKQTQVEDEE